MYVLAPSGPCVFIVNASEYIPHYRQRLLTHSLFPLSTAQRYQPHDQARKKQNNQLLRAAAGSNGLLRAVEGGCGTAKSRRARAVSWEREIRVSRGWWRGHRSVAVLVGSSSEIVKWHFMSYQGGAPGPLAPGVISPRAAPPSCTARRTPRRAMDWTALRISENPSGRSSQNHISSSAEQVCLRICLHSI